MNFLKKGESILFTATYNLSDNNIVNNINTFPVNIEKITNSSNIMAVQSNSCNLKNSSTIYLLENYTLSSYKNNNSKKLGQITWNSLYPNGSSSLISLPSFQKFVVLGASGIFKNVLSVVIDFTNQNRIIYFIGNCNYNIIEMGKNIILDELKKY